MRRVKLLPKYTEEINQLAKDHLEALLAFYLDAFNDGKRYAVYAVAGTSIGIVVGGLCVCIGKIAYHKYKKQS